MCLDLGMNLCRVVYGALISYNEVYLTIIPRARMGSESIAHEAEGRMCYWLRGHQGERNNCFSKIELVCQKYRDKLAKAKRHSAAIVLAFKAVAFHY